jgi:hypothetical protein
LTWRPVLGHEPHETNAICPILRADGATFTKWMIFKAIRTSDYSEDALDIC